MSRRDPSKQSERRPSYGLPTTPENKDEPVAPLLSNFHLPCPRSRGARRFCQGVSSGFGPNGTAGSTQLLGVDGTAGSTQLLGADGAASGPLPQRTPRAYPSPG